MMSPNNVNGLGFFETENIAFLEIDQPLNPVNNEAEIVHNDVLANDAPEEEPVN